ncbi:prolyl oligopeptidase family serine peptidase [Flavobacterium sp. GT3R68]|uniref:prolyl oligopeptidase family serine peptidase n=1 Tax=Flavobacterium sp. GT3R68 TaxID=2594437 RepID=UPI000F876A05|nr:prolyl oligopeptidase family serine peptidase [Flavobacterium sp. GT3R68]RTY95945.1 S9 family peptidase [Flavobacterium sp. GSN2]TRW93717.1 S9 family peptidase [Flavobacterium sp. GT3R68]
MKNILLLICFLFSVSCFSQEYPATRKTPSPITKHDVTFQDDYTWLENFNADEVSEWVNSQNQLIYTHTEEIKKKYSPVFKIKEYDNLSTNGLPEKKGDYFYSHYRLDKSKPAALFYRKKLNDAPIEITNTYRTFKDANVVMTDFYPSDNSKLVAYEVSINGSDLHQVGFTSISKKEDLTDVLKNVKFSNIAWNGEKGVFYKKTSNLSKFDKDSTYQMYYHKIGTIQDDDKLVFDSAKTEGVFTFFTKENKLVIMEHNKEETFRNFYWCSLAGDDFKPEKFIENDRNTFTFLNYSKERIYFSSKDYEWGEIRSRNMNGEDEKVIVPQIYTHLLVDTFFYEDYIICKYKTLGKNYIGVYDTSGQFIRKFDVPYNMDFRIRFFDKETKDLYVTFYSYAISFLNHKLNLETGKTQSYFNDYIEPKPALFSFDHFETKTVTYQSRDGVAVPITIVHKKGISLDGNNPTLLKAYGGFGTISGPVYDTGLLYFMEKGGVFAYAEIRGGGEKGTKWHKNGKGLKKMNTFNDFIDAAEFLIKEKYTSPDKLAITGASQGGLLVGVAMTQRPELFKVAIPQMGVYDMMNFGKYSVGKYHLDEYGDIENKNEFDVMMGYSPFHNIKEGINYPTTLIITSENDDRVPPMHSYKFAAGLQNRAAQKNPIYLKTLSNSGHSGKISNYQNYTEEKAAFYSFLLYHLNK